MVAYGALLVVSTPSALLTVSWIVCVPAEQSSVSSVKLPDTTAPGVGSDTSTVGIVTPEQSIVPEIDETPYVASVAV